MGSKNIHTTYNKAAGNWRNIREDASRPSKVYNTKAEAQADGRQIAINQKSEHFIYNQDGKICQRNSYGNDDFPPQG